MAYQFAGEEIPENEKTWVEIPIVDDADGRDLDVQALVVNGGPGPTLWLQGAIHGDEHTGSIAIRDVVTNLDPGDVAGRIVAVPIVNRAAFNAKSRIAPIDHRDLNRQFPGRADGTYSEMLADELLGHVETHADYFVDLHSGRTETYIEGYSIFTSTDDATERESRALCEAADLPYAIGLEPDDIEGILFALLAEAGIPSVITETGGEGRLHGRHVENAKRAIRNVASEIGLLAVDPDRTTDVSVHDGMVFVKAPTGGFFELAVAANDHVTEGATLAEITDQRGEVKRTITAPCDGVVVSSRTFGAARPGDQLFELAPTSDD